MRYYGFLLLFALSISSGPANTQASVMEFNCTGRVSLNTCTDGSKGLRGNTNSGIAYASTAGFNSQGDGGSGEFYFLGLQTGNPLTSVCLSNTFSNVSVSGNTISNLNTNGLTVGESVSAATGIPQGAEIASITRSNPGSLTMTLAATGAPGTVTISGDNGGTLVLDSESPSKGCYQKTNYRGDPHEWGAYGDGTHDDTMALQNWLGAYGNVSNLPAGTAPSNFGPWSATIPANYLVTSSLVCPTFAVLQGPAIISSGTAGGGLQPSPTVIIKAAPPPSSGPPPFQNTQGLPALMVASPYCRISGIGLDVNGNGTNFFSGTGSTNGTTTVTVATQSWYVPGLPISDSTNCIPAGSAILSVGTGSVTIVTPPGTAVGACPSDTITVTGFYALDVAGTHVGVDGHSLVERGYHNIHCGDLQVDGLQIKDSQIFKSWDTGAYLGSNCANVRLIGDIIERNGQDGAGYGVEFHGNDLSLEDGIVEESGGGNIHIAFASLATVSGMVIDTSGLGPNTNLNPPAAAQSGDGLFIDNSSTISVTGNRFQTSGGGVAGSAHVIFGGTSDNINFAGNTYVTRHVPNSANVSPDSVFDIAGTPTLTNVHIYDAPTQPSVSVFSQAAQPVLASAVVPQFSQNQIAGLTLSPGSDTQKINVAAGAATDTTNAVLMTLASSCTVDFTKNGAGGLDTGSIQRSTTYFIYLVAPAQAHGGSGTNCMASTSLTPAFSGAGYVLGAVGGTFAGGKTVYNVSPLSGVAAGSAVMSSGNLPLNTTIQNFSANAQPSVAGAPITGVFSGTNHDQIIPDNQNITGLQLGMAILDPGGCIPPNTVVESFATSPPLVTSITMSQAASTSCTGDYTFSISGANQLVLNQNANATAYNAPLTISTGYYRLIGALYTDSNMTHPNLVSFAQDGDTFYLTTPVVDINTVASLCTGPIGNPAGAVSCPLSVPSGIKVQAFGRIHGGTSSAVIVSSPDQTPGAPTNFPGVPGYSTKNAGGDTAFPFMVYTDTSAHVRIRANSTGNTTQVYEDTDGWVFHR